MVINCYFLFCKGTITYTALSFLGFRLRAAILSFRIFLFWGLFLKARIRPYITLLTVLETNEITFQQKTTDHLICGTLFYIYIVQHSLHSVYPDTLYPFLLRNRMLMFFSIFDEAITCTLFPSIS